ncbi:MAG: class IV adenylate cyclase [Planctomycetes bacterium]|jgi:adenylate cyclase class 2|nr:class IV adenylate cyclase [Planctomycetota bacterium]
MALEVETKLRVESFTPIRQALRDTQAVYIGTVVHRDRYYDRPDGQFRREGCGLRLRLRQVLKHGQDGKLDDRAEVTYKGPVDATSRLKSRREIQTRLDDAASAADLLDACGLVCVRVIEKRRCSYRLGRALVELDEVPLLGSFVEIEGVSENHIETVRKRLHIDAEHIDDSYLHLVAECCQADDLDPSTITFKNYPPRESAHGD